MRRIVGHRPTPAMAIACVALFVALGGVSYGVATGSIDSREIADGTVRGKDVRNDNLTSTDLRNNEVRAIDIRNGTLRGRDVAVDTLTDDQIDESKLTQVPSAADAARLGGRLPGDFASARPEAVRAPVLAPGVSAAPAPALAPGFWRDPVGTVRLQGSVQGAAGAVFTLPEGYRPAGTVRFVVPSGPGQVTATIDAAGIVDVAGPDPVSLDGIAFRAAG